MEKLQSISWLAFTLVVAAIVFGFRGMEKSVFDIGITHYAYAVFLIGLRFKLALDDHFYFGVTKMERWQSISGLVIAMVSWFFFIFSAYAISQLPESYLLFLVAVGVSTLWIIVVSINSGFYREQQIWIATNALYMIGAGFLLWESKTPYYPSSTWVDAIVRFEYTPILTIILMIVIVIVDFRNSKSLDHAH